jgi:hypothetical protein
MVRLVEDKNKVEKRMENIGYKKGVQHQKIRAAIALSSSSKLDKQIKTFKTPLEFDVSKISNELATIYYTVNGTGLGSLTNYLLTLKSLGFVFRSSAGQVTTLFNQQQFKQGAFKKVAETFFGEDYPELFNPESIYNALTTSKRAKAGVYPEFSHEELIRHYLIRLTGENYRPEGLATKKYEFVSGLCKKIQNSFGSWEEINASPGEVLETFDQYLRDTGFNSPVKFSQIEMQPFPVKNSPIFFAGYGIKPDEVTTDGEKNFLIHVSAHLALHDALNGNHLESITAKKASSLCQSALTTANGNALSWLFGNGLKYFQQSSVNQISDDYGCGRDVAEKIKSVVQNIPYEHAMGKGYSSQRTAVQGALDSWVSNYFNRLFEIHAMIAKSKLKEFSLPEALSEDMANDFFRGLPFDYDGLNNQLKAIVMNTGAIEGLLEQLIGIRPVVDGFDYLGAIKELDRYSVGLNALMGVINVLANRVNQAYEIAEKQNDPVKRPFLEKCVFTSPKFSLDKINQLKIERIDHEKDILLKAKEMSDIINISNAHILNILSTIAPDSTGLDMRIKREKQILKSKGGDEKNARSQAVRHLWSYALKSIRNLSKDTLDEAITQLKTLGLFVPSKLDKEKGRVHSSLNKFMHNRQGEIYKNPNSKSRHQAFMIDTQIDAPTAIENLLEHLEAFAMNQASKNAEQNQTAEVYIKDWINIQKIRFNLNLDRLPHNVPAALIKKPELMDETGFPEQFAFALNASEQVGHDTARKCLNHYMTMLSKRMSFVFRESFLIKMTLTQDKDVGMEWVAKDKDWVLPEKMKMNPVLESLANPQGIIEHDALAKLEASPKDVNNNPDLQNLFKNYPHDLYIKVPFGDGDSIEGRVAYHADKKSFERKKLRGGYARIQAPSKYKSQFLNAMLMDSEMSELARPSYLVEGLVKQHLTIENGEIKVSLDEPEWTLFISQPVNSHPASMTNGEVKSIFDRFVAFDLNEREVGYAVFEMATGQVIQSGTKRIPTLAKLSSFSKKGRKNRDPKQKYAQIFSNKKLKMREHALGELKFFIDNVIDTFDAFPVFESNFNEGTTARDVEYVFNDVLNLYTYSNVSAHKSLRKSYWMSADMWEHPYAQVPEKIEKKGQWIDKTDKQGNVITKPLKLFPGTTVNPFATSQACSCCGINPIAEINRYFDETKEDTIFVDDAGQVELLDGIKIKVEKRFSFEDLPEAEARTLRVSHKRAPWGKKYRAGRYKRSELLKMVREHLRRPNDSLRSKGSLQSEYHCVNVACGHHQKSDENAAVNMGIKLLERISIAQ